MNEIWFRIGSLTVGCLLFAGCNMREPLESSFRDAPFSTREHLEEAMRLDQANHYMRAAEQYDALLRGELTSQQQKAVQSAISELFSRMSKAATRGDAEAIQTLKIIEANQKAKL